MSYTVEKVIKRDKDEIKVTEAPKNSAEKQVEVIQKVVSINIPTPSVPPATGEKD